MTPSQEKKIDRNHPWVSPDTRLTIQGLQINCLKYAPRTEGNHGQITKGNQENNVWSSKE